MPYLEFKAPGPMLSTIGKEYCKFHPEFNHVCKKCGVKFFSHKKGRNKILGLLCADCSFDFMADNRAISDWF